MPRQGGGGAALLWRAARRSGVVGAAPAARLRGATESVGLYGCRCGVVGGRAIGRRGRRANSTGVAATACLPSWPPGHRAAVDVQTSAWRLGGSAASAQAQGGWPATRQRCRGWCLRQESNLYLALRRRLFYPLNYGGLGGQDSRTSATSARSRSGRARSRCLTAL